MMKTVNLSFLVLLCLVILLNCDRYDFNYDDESGKVNTIVGNDVFPVHEWKMDSINADGAVDDSIGNLHLNKFEGGTISLDPVNKISESSLLMNASQLMLKENDTQINYEEEISIEVWIKSNVILPKVPPKNEVIIEKFDKDILEGFKISIPRNDVDANKIIFSVHNSDGIIKTVTSSTLIDNNTQWYHIVAVSDGSKIELYINGVLEGAVNLDGSVNLIKIPDTYDLKIGGLSDTNNESFIGNIDEVRVYNKAITENQIVERYNKTKQ